MTSVDPAELSAYLDGELDAGRSRAIEAALAADPSLRAEFEALSKSDAAWHRTAQAAAFTPTVHWPQSKTRDVSATAAAVLTLVLVVLKLAPKFSDGVAIGLAVNTIALAVALIGIAWLCAPHPSTSSG